MSCMRNANERERFEQLADKTMADIREYWQPNEKKKTETNPPVKKFRQQERETGRQGMERREDVELKKDATAKAKTQGEEVVSDGPGSSKGTTPYAARGPEPARSSFSLSRRLGKQVAKELNEQEKPEKKVQKPKTSNHQHEAAGLMLPWATSPSKFLQLPQRFPCRPSPNKDKMKGKRKESLRKTTTFSGNSRAISPTPEQIPVPGGPPHLRTSASRPFSSSQRHTPAADVQERSDLNASSCSFISKRDTRGRLPHGHAGLERVAASFEVLSVRRVLGYDKDTSSSSEAEDSEEEAFKAVAFVSMLEQTYCGVAATQGAEKTTGKMKADTLSMKVARAQGQKTAARAEVIRGPVKESDRGEF